VFSLDTSGFLDAWTRNYPPDTFQAFWDRMDAAATAETIKVSEEVARELAKKDDGAAAWIEARTVMIVSTDVVIQEKVKEILKTHPRLVNASKSRSGGDPFVIAVASIYKYSVITGELPTGNLKKPHIPDVCSALGVPFMNLLEFVRSQGWKF
jgi:Domain of unknown function (DUF4411)